MFNDDGFVYVLSNPAMPGLVKIGSAQCIKQRLQQLHTTGVPLPFQVEGSVKLRDRSHAYIVERKVHAILIAYRVAMTREFFRLSTDHAISVVYSTAANEFRNDVESVKSHKSDSVSSETENVNIDECESTTQEDDDTGSDIENVYFNAVLDDVEVADDESTFLCIEKVMNAIKSNRPSLKESTLVSYQSTLRGIFSKTFSQNSFDFNLVGKHPDTVMKHLDILNSQSRKARLAVLVVACEACSTFGEFDTAVSVFRKAMLVHRDEQSDNDESSPSDLVKWTDIQLQVTKLGTFCEHIMKTTQIQLPHESFKYLQMYMVALLYTTIPPRHLQDYIFAKMRNFEKTKDNWFDLSERKFYFNRHRAFSIHGLQIVDIPIQLAEVMQRWMDMNPKCEWLLMDSRGGQMSSVKLNAYIQKVFHRKGLSVNILRHSYLSKDST